MAKTTITEALAELKTLAARVNKKRTFVMGILGRQEKFKDQFEDKGGSKAVILTERQAIQDLEERVISIRSAIQQANRETKITVEGRTRTIHDWLVWRRDVSKGHKDFIETIQRNVATIRSNAQKQGYGVNVAEGAKPDDVVIHVDEYALAQEVEQMEKVLGTLDGQLSLKNATVTIDV